MYIHVYKYNIKLTFIQLKKMKVTITTIITTITK